MTEPNHDLESLLIHGRRGGLRTPLPSGLRKASIDWPQVVRGWLSADRMGVEEKDWLMRVGHGLKSMPAAVFTQSELREPFEQLAAALFTLPNTRQTHPASVANALALLTQVPSLSTPHGRLEAFLRAHQWQCAHALPNPDYGFRAQLTSRSIEFAFGCQYLTPQMRDLAEVDQVMRMRDKGLVSKTWNPGWLGRIQQCVSDGWWPVGTDPVWGEGLLLAWAPTESWPMDSDWRARLRDWHQRTQAHPPPESPPGAIPLTIPSAGYGPAVNDLLVPCNFSGQGQNPLFELFQVLAWQVAHHPTLGRQIDAVVERIERALALSCFMHLPGQRHERLSSFGSNALRDLNQAIVEHHGHPGIFAHTEADVLALLAPTFKAGLGTRLVDQIQAAYLDQALAVASAPARRRL